MPLFRLTTHIYLAVYSEPYGVLSTLEIKT